MTANKTILVISFSCSISCLSIDCVSLFPLVKYRGTATSKQIVALKESRSLIDKKRITCRKRERERYLGKDQLSISIYLGFS